MAVVIVTYSLPGGVTGTAYSKTIQASGGTTPYVFSVQSGTLPTGLSLSGGGVLSGTPTTPGTYDFVVRVTDNASEHDDQSYSVLVTAPLVLTPDDSPCTTIQIGDQILFGLTGGSGSFIWSVTGRNLITQNGLLTAIDPGNATVTVVDTVTGLSVSANVCIEGQSQFCVVAEPICDTDNTEEPCCELVAQCGVPISLRVPSFHLLVDGRKEPVVYSSVKTAQQGDAAGLTAMGANAGATGNAVAGNRSFFFEIATSYDMAQTGNGEFAIGWSSQDIDESPLTIEHSVVWHTNSGRKVKVRNAGADEASSSFTIAQGDVVRFGYNVNTAAFELYINDVLKFTSAENSLGCDTMVLDIAIVTALKTIGGYVTNLSWAFVGGQIGSVDSANGIYYAPATAEYGLTRLVGTVGNSQFFVNVRLVQPSPKLQHPQPFLKGRLAEVWVFAEPKQDSAPIRLAGDGTPDAIQNPGGIFLGILKENAKFEEQNDYTDFTNDVGILDRVLSSEKAMLTGTFQEIRDLEKLAVLMQHGTLYPLTKGIRRMTFGGKSCFNTLRAALIVRSGDCNEGYDVLELYRVVSTGNLAFDVGKKAQAEYPFTLEVLLDISRQPGDQLYSIYQIDCASNGCSF